MTSTNEINETVTNESNETMEKIQGFVESAMKAVTTEMANEIAAKVVNMIELADDVIQPETVDLLRKLPDVSKSIEKTLDELTKLEETGTLQTLIQLGGMVSSMKQAATTTMVTELMEKVVSVVEFIDELEQSGSLDLIKKAIHAFEEAKIEQEGKEPLTPFQITKALRDHEIREVITLLLSFAKKIANKEQ